MANFIGPIVVAWLIGFVIGWGVRKRWATEDALDALASGGISLLEARPAERSAPNVGMRDAEAKDELVGAPAEEQPDARAGGESFADEQRRKLGQAYASERAANAALTKELAGLREQLDAANRETGEYRRMWEETLRQLDGLTGVLGAAANPLSRLKLTHSAACPFMFDGDCTCGVEAIETLVNIARAALGDVAAAPDQATDSVGALGQKASETRADADKEAL